VNSFDITPDFDEVNLEANSAYGDLPRCPGSEVFSVAFDRYNFATAVRTPHDETFWITIN
jgi:hypothetical protein